MSKVYLDVVFAIRVSGDIGSSEANDDFVAEIDYDILSDTPGVDILSTDITAQEFTQTQDQWLVLLTIRLIVDADDGIEMDSFINEVDYEFRSDLATIVDTEMRHFEVVDSK